MAEQLDPGSGLYLPANMAPTAGGYDGAVESRRRKKHAFRRSLPFDEDMVIGSGDRERLRLECLDLRRNNPIVAGVCERFADNIVGPQGIRPQVKTTDEAWNNQAEEFWKAWEKVSDYRGRSNFRDLQRLTIDSRLLAGECGFVLTKGGQLQPVEAGRIGTPNKYSADPRMVEGIRVTVGGRKTSYHVLNRDQRGRADKTASTTVRAEDFIHCMRAMRFDQIRGVPELAPVLNTVSDFGRLQEEVLNRAVLDALHAWVVKSDQGAAKIGNLGPRGSQATLADSQQKYEYFDGGQTYYMKPGESVESLASTTPNSQFVPYSEQMLRMIGAALSIPYEFLVLDFKQGSFSASRAALMQTYRTFSMWQSWLVDTLLQRTWNWRIAKAIREGDLPPAPLDTRGVSQWYKVRWSLPDYGWIDPKAEATSNEKEFALGTASITSIAAKRGRDGEEVLREKANDIATAHRIADEINQLHGTSIGWRDIIGVTSKSPAAPPPIPGIDE